MGAIEKVLEHMARVGGGRLVVSMSPAADDGSSPHIVVGYEFGREAADSDMVGGAAYGAGTSVEAAFAPVLADLRLT